MIIEFDLPEVAVPEVAVANFFLNSVFHSTPSKNFQVRALATTFVRLVEAACVEYGLGASALRAGWSDTQFAFSTHNRSTAHFESCVSDMHRAIHAYSRLRNHPSRDDIAVLLAQDRPSFRSDAIASRIMRMRDAVHHLEQMLFNGQVVEGQPITLMASGPERTHPTEAGQTIKTMDRLEIGPHQIRFSEIATWLDEMSSIVLRIAQFIPARPLDTGKQ